MDENKKGINEYKIINDMYVQEINRYKAIIDAQEKELYECRRKLYNLAEKLVEANLDLSVWYKIFGDKEMP